MSETPVAGTAVKLCVLTTHPIQYIAPWYRALAMQRWLDLHVVFARVPTPAEQGRGFDHAFAWDTPLREGYASTVLEVPPGTRHALGGALAFRRLLQNIVPDAVLVTGWNEPLLVAGLLAARSLGLPVLMRGESNSKKRRSATVTFAQRCLLKLPVACLEIGSANRRFYVQHGVDGARVFPGCYFVDNARMLAMAAEHAGQRAALRQSMGFVADDVVFVFCGKHVAFKQPQLLIEAAAMARTQGAKVKVLFAGSGPLTASLQAVAERLAVPAYFCGFLNQSELWKAYVPADAFVLPSTATETWGLVTNEAMLFGLPVLVSNQVGCVEDLVREGQTGLAFEPTPEHLAQAMMHVASDRGLAARMGRAAREHVVAQCSMEVATAGLREALQHVLGRPHDVPTARKPQSQQSAV